MYSFIEAEESEFKTVLLSANEYSININGIVKDKEGTVIPTEKDSDGDVSVVINLWNGVTSYKVAMLVIINFMANRNSSSIWDKIIPMYKDGNPENLNPSNLVYRYPPYTPHPKLPGFYCIPYFNYYGITPEGEVRFTLTGKTIENSSHTNGYRVYSIDPDIGTGKFGIGRHRLLCLAFKEYDARLEKMDVNHEDGIPGSDALSNLEWMTRSQNMYHAYEMGLRKDNYPTLMRNVFTGKVSRFVSITQCSRHLGLNDETVRLRLQTEGQKLYSCGHQFKLESDDTPWREVKDPIAEFKKNGCPMSILSHNVFTGETILYPNVSDAGRATGIKHATIHWMLKNKALERPIHGYLFKREWDDTPWPTFTPFQLERFKECPIGVMTPAVEVYDLVTGNTEVFVSKRQCKNKLGLKKDQVNDSIRHGYKAKNRYCIKLYNECPLV